MSLGCWHMTRRGHSRSCDTSPVQEPCERWTEPLWGMDTPGVEAARGADVPRAAPAQIPGSGHVPSLGAGGPLGLETGPVRDGGEDLAPAPQQLPQPLLVMLK